MKGKNRFFLWKYAFCLFLLWIDIRPYAVYGQTLEDYAMQLRDIEVFGNNYLRAYSDMVASNYGFSLNQGWPSGEIGARFKLSFELVAASSFIPINDKNRFISTALLPYSPNVQSAPLTSGAFSDNSGGAINLYVLDPLTGNRMVNPINGEYLAVGFNLLEGLGTDVGLTPSLMPQLNLGLGLGTELSFRILPVNVGIGQGRLDLFSWGVSARHDLLQWFGTAANKRPFGLQAAVSYVFNTLDYQADRASFLEYSNAYFSTEGSDLQIGFNTGSWQALISASYKLPRFATLYAQAGRASQVNRLSSSGQFIIRVEEGFVSSDYEENTLEIPDLFDSSSKSTAFNGGFGLLLGRGFLQADLRYVHVQAHIVTVGLRTRLIRK